MKILRMKMFNPSIIIPYAKWFIIIALIVKAIAYILDKSKEDDFGGGFE